MRPTILDLFCGAGGAGEGYRRAGFDVIGVDIAPQPNHPEGMGFLQGDALDFVAKNWRDFDAIHASPPCQRYLNLGGVNRAQGRTYEHPDLIAETRRLLIASGLPYVIENVQDARKQLRNPARLCGTSFGRPLRRHRLFETNFSAYGKRCEHHLFTEPKYWTGWRPNGEVRLSTVVQVYGNAGGREHWPAAMGIDWMTPKEMSEAIPPDYTEWIGRQLLDEIGSDAA